MKKSKRKKLIISLVITLFVLMIVLPFGLSIYLYEEYFGTRYETYEPFRYTVDDFEGLRRMKYEFPSNEGQQLTGYLYYVDGEEYKGIVAMAHGFGGGGHNSYMDCANYFAHHGYYAFAFDATGNDESEGDSVKGLPQGVIDLDYAISFLENINELKDMPIMLFGHSWGGYAATNVLEYHPEVKAVVSFSGFNRSSDLIESQGREMVGGWIKLFMPYIRIYEWLKFGNYSTNTAIKAFADSDVSVMIFHSADDMVVLPEYGYDLWMQQYGNSERFTFIEFEDKGHNDIFYSTEALAWRKEFNKQLKEWGEQLPYNYKEDTNSERFSKDKADYLHENLDRTMWSNLIDEELFAEITAFYDSNLTD